MPYRNPIGISWNLIYPIFSYTFPELPQYIYKFFATLYIRIFCDVFKLDLPTNTYTSIQKYIFKFNMIPQFYMQFTCLWSFTDTWCWRWLLKPLNFLFLSNFSLSKQLRASWKVEKAWIIFIKNTHNKILYILTYIGQFPEPS